MSDTKVTDACMAHLQHCSALQDLEIAGTQVTGRQFSRLSSNAINLNVDRTAVTNATLGDIFEIPGLKSLSLKETQVTGEVSPPATLERLELSHCPLSDLGIRRLAQTALESLSVSSTNFTDDHLMLFSANDTLQFLDASSTKITEAGLRSFYEARKKRPTAAGKKETLFVGSDFTDLAEQYVADRFDEGFLMNGQPISGNESQEQPQTTP